MPADKRKEEIMAIKGRIKKFKSEERACLNKINQLKKSNEASGDPLYSEFDVIKLMLNRREKAKHAREVNENRLRTLEEQYY